MFPIRIVISKEWVDWYKEHEEDIHFDLLSFGVMWFAFAIAGANIAQYGNQWSWLGWSGLFFPLWLAIGYSLYRGIRWMLPKIIVVKVKRGLVKEKNVERDKLDNLFCYEVVASDGIVSNQSIVSGIVPLPEFAKKDDLPMPIPSDDMPGKTWVAEFDPSPIDSKHNVDSR